MNPPLLVQEVLEPKISEGGEASGEASPSLHLSLSWGCAAVWRWRQDVRLDRPLH